MKMRLMYFLAIIAVAVTACKKNKGDHELSDLNLQGPFVGVWVEASIGKDTINFNANQSMVEYLPNRPPSNAGIFIMGSEKYKMNDGSFVTPGGIYSYYRKDDSLYLFNFYNSTINFTGYKFALEANNQSQSFTIERFYERPGLKEEITFNRIR